MAGLCRPFLLCAKRQAIYFHCNRFLVCRGCGYFMNTKNHVIKMKQLLMNYLLAVCAALVITPAGAQSWVTVGSAGFSDSAVANVSTAVDRSGTPYVVYSDSYYGWKTTVMKFDGTNWVPVGSKGFSAGGASATTIAIDTSGRPFVCFSDGGNGGKATVMKYDGSGWVTVGSAGFSPYPTGGLQMALDKAGTPYVVFIDSSWGGAASVMKYNGSSWVAVGSLGFTAALVAYVSIAINPAGVPYIVYQDGLDGAATVQRFNGGGWSAVGGAGFTMDRSLYTQIAIDNTGALYVVYSNFDVTNSATVMKFDGSSWTKIGGAGFSPGYAVSTAIALDSSGTPFAFFLDDIDSDKTTVMKFDGSWVNVGSPDFSSGALTGGYMSNVNPLAVDAGGTPYVGYEDTAHSHKATVMKIGFPTEVKKNIGSPGSLTVLPDPNHGVFVLNISSATNESATIVITNALGERVKELRTMTNQHTAVQLDCPAGIYFINAVTKTERLSAKIFVD